VCFSFEADLVAAAVLTPIGILSIRAARTPRELPLASIPLIFAAHQFTEAWAWAGLDGRVSNGVMQFAIDAFLIVAQVVLPTLVPLAMLLVEPIRRRRVLMALTGVVGLVNAVAFSLILVEHGAYAYADGNTMIYKTPVDLGWAMGVAYLLPTCVAPILSSSRQLRALGVANLVGIGVVIVAKTEAATSVWCAYSAFVSVLILLHLRATHRDEDDRARQRERRERAPELVGGVSG
jgi:heme exporter protein D